MDADTGERRGMDDLMPVARKIVYKRGSDLTASHRSNLAYSIAVARTVVTAFAEAATTPTRKLYEFVGIGFARGE